MTKKNGKIIDEKTTCKLIFIDSIRFMLDSLSNLVYNFAEDINKNECKYYRDKCL